MDTPYPPLSLLQCHSPSGSDCIQLHVIIGTWASIYHSSLGTATHHGVCITLHSVSHSLPSFSHAGASWRSHLPLGCTESPSCRLFRRTEVATTVSTATETLLSHLTGWVRGRVLNEPPHWLGERKGIE